MLVVVLLSGGVAVSGGGGSSSGFLNISIVIVGVGHIFGIIFRAVLDFSK